MRIHREWTARLDAVNKLDMFPLFFSPCTEYGARIWVVGCGEAAVRRHAVTILLSYSSLTPDHDPRTIGWPAAVTAVSTVCCIWKRHGGFRDQIAELEPFSGCEAS